MAPGGYLAGVVILLAAAGGSGFAAIHICRRSLPLLAGPVRAVTLLLLSSSLLAFCVLLPGMLGILSRGTFVGTAVLLAVVAAALDRESKRPSLATPGSPARPSAATPGSPVRPGPTSLRRLAVPAAAVIVLGGWVVGELLTVMSKPPLAVDFISYDLPIIGHWIQSGSVWHITELFPLQTHGTYPQTADLLLAAFVLPFHNDALVGIVPCLALGGTGLATYCTLRELRASLGTAITLAAMFCAIPTVAWAVQSAPPDAVAVAAFATGLLFLLRHVRSGRSSDLALAALGLGFAAGSLWYFSSAVVVVGLAWTATILVPRGLARSKSWRQTFSRAGVLLGVALAVSGFWLVRNLVETGDPFYPVRIAVAGHTIFPAPPDLYRAVAGFSVADYLGSPHVLTHYIWPALTKAAGLPGLVLLLGLGLVAWRAASEIARRRRPSDLAPVLLLISALLVVLYVVTPYSAFGLRNRPVLAGANVRYLVPAMGIALAALAALIAATRRRFLMVLELAACAATIEGVVVADRSLGTEPLFLVIGLAGGVLAGASGWLWRRSAGRPVVRPATRATALAGAIVVLIPLGYVAQRSANRTRYAAYDPTFAWMQAHPSPLRVGLAGSFNFHGPSPAWPMFGERIQNRVAFVGLLRSGHLTQYRNRQAWLAAVRRGGYDVLEIATGHPPPYTTDNEPRWAAESGFPVISRSERFELVRVTG